MEDLETNLVEFSVSELSGAIKRQIEDSFGRVRVRGELGRVSRPASGHVYFDVKDDKTVLASVAWKAVVQKMSVQPEQGLEVILTGRLTTFAGQSRYQLVVDTLEPAGEGALMALLEARRKQLAFEGVFDAANKQELPFLPQCIGVVTSPSGAVIRDILHRLTDRFPCHVLVWPVRVQGDTCADEVARAIAGFNALAPDGPVARPDVLIVARGGGSLEDLWPFNEEVVARTAAQSDIPLISAVGHETDTTLIDYAADWRAPTPTAAAEMAVPVRAELQASLADLQGRQLRAQMRQFERLDAHVSGLARGLPKFEDLLALPRQLLDNASQRLGAGLSKNVGVHATRAARIAARLNPATLGQRTVFFHQRLNDLDRGLHTRMRENIRQAHQAIDAMGRQLTLLSHESVLQRGFALVTNATGLAVRQPDDAPVGSNVDIQLAGGKNLAAQITADAATSDLVSQAAPQAAPQAKPKAEHKKPAQKKAKPVDDAQGELL